MLQEILVTVSAIIVYASEGLHLERTQLLNCRRKKSEMNGTV